jgi:hypothetical protein
MKINLCPNFTAMVTVHGKTRSYLHRFKIIESPDCSCSNRHQTVGHLLYDCSELNNERGNLVAHIWNEDHWPIKKSELLDRHLKQVIHFTNFIDYKKL